MLYCPIVELEYELLHCSPFNFLHYAYRGDTHVNGSPAMIPEDITNPEESTERLQSVTYMPLEIDITLEQIEDTYLCMVCEKPAAKTLVDYEQPYTNRSKQAFIATCQVPGYKCASCGTEVYDLPARVHVLEAALKVVEKARDHNTALDIKDSVKAANRHLAAFSQSSSQ